jgi:two-component system nitrogen regulation response regulator GlnG
MPKLLIVDDEPNVLYSLKKRLRTGALDVVTAGTARQGIHLVRQEQPDAVLLDIRLPDMSGLDAFDQIHALGPGTSASCTARSATRSCWPPGRC